MRGLNRSIAALLALLHEDNRHHRDRNDHVNDREENLHALHLPDDSWPETKIYSTTQPPVSIRERALAATDLWDILEFTVGPRTASVSL